MNANAINPASSGPAGSHFEGQVGAYYLLSMLTGSEPRGLPGTEIARIEFQRAAEGRPLDDVIVHAHDTFGNSAVLEIQVKRTITFAPGDPVFRDVMGQIIKASLRPEFWVISYELAIATARTSKKIDGAYQDVLTWARQLGDAVTFMARINRPGSANDDMRTFVQTFRSHMQTAGQPTDDEAVWRLLRKLQILIFDFTAQGSASEELCKERTVRALHPDDTLRAGNLWTTLVELALQVAKNGGDRTRVALIEDLNRQSFRLTGFRRFSTARAALAEASQHALADIDDKVGNVTLTRHELVTAVHAARDVGRYIEIRGDAGVGKSGVLKHFAEQIAKESHIVLLSPGRIPQRGWTNMKAVLAFDGTARELLSDLAGDGGSILFIDNLDFFTDEERKSVIDLVREAATVPGFAVIVTARRNFGMEVPTWLPSEAIASLGCAEPIIIDELSETEVAELRSAAPMLVPLLADTHPARAVSRNLFRLSRLASLPGGGSFPRTEVDMAEQWWQTADGSLGDDHRERSRLLRALAEMSILSTGPIDVSDHPAQAVNTLVASETLIDLGNDHVAFRHDVLREWAIANLLYSKPALIERLPFDRPAPAALARGIELYARMLLERASDSDGTRWKGLIESLSRQGLHGSWRRVVLLSLVRSEVGGELLTRVSDLLFADCARLLRELIRIVIAVDVQPGKKIFSNYGIPIAMIPDDFNIPSGPSWHRLIFWLLSLGERLPVVAIPDVVTLYTGWSMGMIGRDPLTPSLLQWLYRWLTEIETAREAETFHEQREPFNGELDHDFIGSLENDLRTGFLMFCNQAPSLAAEYLQSLGRRRRSEDIALKILRYRGALAQAAPAELAELTATALIPERRPKGWYQSTSIAEPFGLLDHEFVPVSPLQGPFFDLLTHAPQHGLSLIRQLVDHAISFHSRGRACGANAIRIILYDGERVFPWRQSYGWSREWSGEACCVTSALMALEAWAHRRIEAGESINEIIKDVLGPPGSPTAYLLVAVDLLLSHWPKTREVLVPFLACPELLCLDRERYSCDSFKDPDIFGLKALQKEPIGVVSVEDLKKRASRKFMIDKLLGNYAVNELFELRKTLYALLQQSAERLGPPDAQSDLSDPAFMVAHALNLIDPGNWHEESVTSVDGEQMSALRYVSPMDEEQHFERLKEATQETATDAKMQEALRIVLDDPSRSTPKFAEAALEWAQIAATVPKGEDADEDWIREEAIYTAAMIVMRDGDADLRKRYAVWGRNIFIQALQSKEDPVHRHRSGLRFNPIAIAFAGMIHLLKDHATPDDIRILLEVAASGNPAAAYGFGAAAVKLAAINERLPRAVLRSAFAASIRPWTRGWDIPENEASIRSERYQQRVKMAVDGELDWLADERPEPDWPTFPSEPIRRRPGIWVGGGVATRNAAMEQHSTPETYIDHQAAAIWLRNTEGLVDSSKRPWIRDVIQFYSAWSAIANGAELEPFERIDHPPTEWNDAYFDIMARCLPGLDLKGIEKFALVPIISLPDESFFDIVTQFLRSVDIVYFNNHSLQEVIAVNIRLVLANRMMSSRGWKRLVDSRSDTIEVHIAPAIAVFFFNDRNYFQPAKCYLLEKGIDMIDPFLPVLKDMIESGPSLFVAFQTLNLLEVSPRSAQFPLMLAAIRTWMKSYPGDSTFWVNNDIGRRVCVWIEKIRCQEPTLFDSDRTAWPDVDRLLTALVSLGVPDASRLEEALSRGSVPQGVNHHEFS